MLQKCAISPVPSDIDEDGIADVYDLDTDGDGSTDEEEFSNGTDPMTMSHSP